MVISKGEFQQWKDSLVTQAFFEAAQVRIEDAKEILATKAGIDPDEDNFFRGFIFAYNEMKDFRVEDMTDDD